MRAARARGPKLPRQWLLPAKTMRFEFSVGADPGTVSLSDFLKRRGAQADLWRRCLQQHNQFFAGRTQLSGVEALQIGNPDARFQLADFSLDRRCEFRVLRLHRGNKNRPIRDGNAIGVIAHIVERSAAEPRLPTIRLALPD